jgi:hypothetical protein
MFERLMLHGAALARRAAQERRSALAAELRDEAPEGVRVSEDSESVTFEGRGLGRRFALDSELRWLLSGRRR